MRDLSRRHFIKTGISGAAATSLGMLSSKLQASSSKIDKVKLGNTGVELSRLALGTGTHGWKFRSDQTKLGTKGFVELPQI